MRRRPRSSRRPLAGGLALALLALLPTAARAHTGAGPAAGFLHGFAHPIAGADHLLAMVAVGMWAAQHGGRALWALPAAFVGTMLAGGAIGAAGAPLPGVEAGIVLSVLALGALVGLRARPRLGPAIAVVAAAALLHGYAHGAEMPAAAPAIGYAAGFATATALLHVSGIVAVAALARTGRPVAAARLDTPRRTRRA